MGHACAAGCLALARLAATLVRVRPWLSIGVVLLVLLCAALALAQYDGWAETDAVILHEPMPTAAGLMAADSDDPVLVFDEGAGGSDFPSEIVRDGVRLPSPDSSLEGSGDDLLYVTRSSPSSPPAPGTVHNVEREVRPDRETGREPWLTYHAVFDPAIIPFKRNSAKDRVRPDGALVVGYPALVEQAVIGNRLEPGREVFWGSILVELAPGLPVPIPSVSPQSRVLSYETAPEVVLRIFKDGADNFYVDGDYKGRIRVNFVMDAPGAWFHHNPGPGFAVSDVPEELRPRLPSSLDGAVATVATHIGVRPADDYATVLRKLVYYFRDFDPGELPPSGGSDYQDLALAQKGVCRHRAYAFVITAHGLGIPARYVSNEAHVFAEVWTPGGAWVRIDLGGGAQGMNVRNSGRKTQHSAAGADPFGFPPGFQDGYSHRAAMGASEDDATGDPVHGLPAAGSATDTATGAGAAPGAPSAGSAWSGRPSPWGTPRARLVEVDTNKRPTTTSVDHISARVYRGDKLVVRGVVESDGDVVEDGRVRIHLMDRDQRRIIRVLGTASVASDGTFRAAVPMPMDIDLGTWEIIAEYGGDSEHASSHSR